jgi:ABC-type branched-subunit amino acid transport system permease subunit
MQNVVFQSDLMFGVETSVAASRPKLGFIDGTNDRWYYFVCLAIVVCVAGVLAAVARGQLGMLLRGLAEAPTMLATNGLNVHTTKLLVFCASSFLAALGGGMMVTQYGSVSGQSFGPVQSLVLIAVLGMCGRSLIRSPILAALLFSVLPGYVRDFDTNRQLVLFGVAAATAALLLANREALRAGIAHAARVSRDRRRHGPVVARRRPSTLAAHGGIRP